MKLGWLGRGLLAAAALAGCRSVIDRAREAQQAAAPDGSDELAAYTNAPAAHVVLRDCSLVDYVAFAVTNRSDLEAARLAVSNAVLELAQVTSDEELQLALSGGFSQSTANGSHFSWHQRPGTASADISAELLVYDFGRIDAREAKAREQLVAARRDLADAEFDVFSEVAEAYFTVLRNDALLDVARSNEVQYAEHLAQAESLFKAGESKKLDVLKARVDLSDAHLETINASNSVVTAGAKFIQALGLQTDRATRADVLSVRANTLADEHRTLVKTVYGAEEALFLARTNAPSLLALRARLRAASAEVDYRVADILPEISLTSAFSFADPAWNWSWGFRAVQSILDGYRKRTAVDIAVVALDTARLDLYTAEQKLAHDLAVAVSTRDNARDALATARVEVEQARENLETVVQQYRVGDASRLDFTDAASALATALGARVKTFYAAEIAEAALIRLTGHVPDRNRKPLP